MSIEPETQRVLMRTTYESLAVLVLLRDYADGQNTGLA